MPRLHLVIGPVGAGKTTFARALCREHDAVSFELDAWMAVLYGDDERPAEGRIAWYRERVGRCIEQIWQLTRRLMELDTDVVLELGLVEREPRQAFYGRIDAEAFEHTVYVLDAPREVRRERVRARNRDRGETFAMVVPDEFFELASDLWDPPDDSECGDRDVRFPSA